MYRTIIFLILIFLSRSACSKEIPSEILGIYAKENCLLINVARNYPQVKITKLSNGNPKDYSIELINSKSHKSFDLTLTMTMTLSMAKEKEKFKKDEILKELNFLNDISVSFAGGEGGEGGENGSEKLNLLLSFKSDADLVPKLYSTKDNFVKIAFVPSLPSVPVDPALSKNALKEKILELYNTAVDKQTQGNLDDAEKLYKEVLSYDEEFLNAKYNLAKIYLDKNNYTDSIALLQSLALSMSVELQKSPQDLTFTKSALANAYSLNGNFNEALKSYKDILNNKPDSYESFYGIGLVYEKMKDLKQAETNFKKAADLKPDFPDAYYHLGVLNLINGRKKDSQMYFKKVIELAPESKLALLSKNELSNYKKNGK